MKQKSKYYVVWAGNKPGIYGTWNDCRLQISGFQGAVYKSFDTMAEAEKAFRMSPSQFIGINKKSTKVKVSPTGAKPDPDSLSVDAACSGNPGDLEYRGVETASHREIFHMGPYPEGTVNIGEFLAIVHALALLVKTGVNMPVYSDSKTAIKWVKDKKANTKLAETDNNKKLFELVRRAETWLKNNEYPFEVRKWETQYWGEIPADFGRK